MDRLKDLEGTMIGDIKVCNVTPRRYSSKCLKNEDVGYIRVSKPFEVKIEYLAPLRRPDRLSADYLELETPFIVDELVLVALFSRYAGGKWLMSGRTVRWNDSKGMTYWHPAARGFGCLGGAKRKISNFLLWRGEGI